MVWGILLAFLNCYVVLSEALGKGNFANIVILKENSETWIYINVQNP